MTAKGHIAMMLLAILATADTVQAGWIILDQRYWPNETRSPSRYGSNQSAAQPISLTAIKQKAPPPKATPQVNNVPYGGKASRSCTYRGGPKTGIWACR